MIIDFNHLNDKAQIWFFQSGDKFSDSEKENIELKINDLGSNWQSHGEPVQAGFEWLVENRILVVGAETSSFPSGCSKDKLFSVIENLSIEFGKSLINPTLINYENESGKVETISFLEFKKLLKSNDLNGSTTFFDHTITTKGDLQYFQKHVSESWLKRFLPNES